MSGQYAYLTSRRDGILATARISPAARARIKGEKVYQPAAKAHTITVDCAKPDERKVKEGAPVVVLPVLPPAPVQQAVIATPVKSDEPNGIAAVQHVFLGLLRAAGYQIEGQPYGLMEMRCERRSRLHSWPRQVCMDLVRRLTPASYPAIGQAFGGKDHTTVMCAIKRTPHHLATNPLLAEAHAKVLALFEAQK